MKTMNNFMKGALIVLVGLLASCKDEHIEINDNITTETQYFVGIEAGVNPATDILATAESITEGTISPEGNGFEQPAWMTFIQGKNQIFAAGYTSAPQFTSYELSGGQLVEGESFFLDETPYSYDIIDENTMLIVSSPRAGFSEKKLFLVNTDQMAITKTVASTFGDIKADSLLAFPTDAKVRGNKLFISYNHIHANGDFSTPKSNVARVAVFSYPELVFEKLISDDRASNIGRYYGLNSLEIDENGDIYTFSSSSIACGYMPVPENNSAILRIKNGQTDFDPNYYIDFETLTGGYKINDMLYVGNGKAVLRVLKEDENNEDMLWKAYTPISENPLLEAGIIDLNTKSFTILDEVPLGGGGWNTPYLIEDNKVYLGVSNSAYAGIYIIDTETASATEGATIDGNYAKGILSLTE